MIANHRRSNEVQDSAGCLSSVLLLLVGSVVTAIGISAIIITTGLAS